MLTRSRLESTEETTGMSSIVATVPSISAPGVIRRKVLIATAVGLVAACWFVLLSGWLGVMPGTVTVKRNNVLFNSDTSSWMHRMTDTDRPREDFVHPLDFALWRPECRGLYHLLHVFLPPEYAAILACRLFVGSVAGLGVGFMALLALSVGIGTTQLIPLFLMYLLFSSSSTVALPEHFGISNGLLSLTFIVPLAVTNTAMRTAFLAVMAILCGGTTITNAIFPLWSFYRYIIRPLRQRFAIVAVAGSLGLAAFIFVYLKSSHIHSFVIQYLNRSVLYHPWRVVTYTIYAVICPAVAPTPRVYRVPGWDMVFYETGETLRLSYYFGIQAIGAIAWAILLLMSVYKGLQDDRTRQAVQLLLGWVLFNIVFHNVWGIELFLYAPHWSWALMGLVILGIRHLPRWVTGLLVVPIMGCQIYTLLAIKSALQTIVE